MQERNGQPQAQPTLRAQAALAQHERAKEPLPIRPPRPHPQGATEAAA